MSEKRNNVVPINTTTSPVTLFEIETLFENLINQYISPKLPSAINVLIKHVSEKQQTAVSNIELMQLIETEKKLKSTRSVLVEKCISFAYDSINEWARTDTGTERTLSDDDLCLVDNSTLEYKLTWQAAARQMEMCEQIQNFYNCESRLKDYITPDSPQIPIGSMTLCQSFSTALTPLKLNLDTTHEFLSLFAKHMKLSAAQMWQQADIDLSELGLELNTPKISSYSEISEKTEIQNSPDESPAGDGILIDQIAQQVVSKVESLIGQKINKTMSATGSDSLIVSPANYPTQDLASTLTSIQDDLSEQSLVISNLSESIKHALINRGITQHLSPRQEDLINLVGLLFEFIIDDHELPDVIKKVIGLLQIPVLKLALIDQDFLINRQHPGRQLLNDMTSAGMQCRDNDNPAINLIETTVMKIIHNFTDNPNIFSECLYEFNQSLLLINNNSLQPVNVEYWKTGDSEDNSPDTTDLSDDDAEQPAVEVHATETINPVDEMLNTYLSRYAPPKTLNELVCTGWRAVLQFSLEQNHSDEQWFHRINTMDMLLWSLQGDHQKSIQDDDWQALKNYLLDLLNEVEINPFVVAEWFHAINAITNRQLDLEEEIVIQRDGKQESIQQNFGAENHWEPEPPDSECDTSDPNALHEALSNREMPAVGQWVEFIGENDRRLRCKLATVNLITNRYVFVNKSGMKVAEWSGSELVTAINNHRVELLDNHQFFDRALQAVMGNFLKF